MNMSRRSDLIKAFCIALILHAVAGLCVGGLQIFRVDADMEPLFKKGESSVFLTLESLPFVPQVQQKDSKTDNMAILEIVEEKKKIDDDNVPVPKDADALVKGVETLSDDDIELPRPLYPLGAKIRGEEGLVTVKVRINAESTAVVEVVQSSGYPSLDRSAVNAAKKAGFGLDRNNSFSSVETNLTFRFKLVD
ncbi:energy transducer TonB [Verrucomicrobiota bacterium]